MNQKLLYRMLGSLFLLGPAFQMGANPQNPTIISGDVSFNQTADTMTVTSTSSRSIVNWESFSINTNEVTTFMLPASDSAILNRVTSSQGSNILGTLTSNGQVYLINPNGILFGPDAVINTSAFLASSLDTTNEEFLNALDMTFLGAENSDIFVINYGTITASEGDIVLLGYQVQNSGELNAENGRVAIGGGLELILQPTSDNRIGVVTHTPLQVTSTGLNVGGFISAVKAELQADGNLYEFAINHDGWINAQGTVLEDARVRFVAVDGKTTANGLITAANNSGFGGRVDITGNDVVLDNSCFISVNAAFGEGLVNVGGSLGGTDPDLINSQSTFVASTAEIHADALYFGNGGTVAVWSDGPTDYQGFISATGGIFSGDGGLVQTHGNPLSDTGTYDVSAPNGSDGTVIH